MLNQSLRRLQEVCRKLARHALLLNPMPSRLAPQSEVLWSRMTERHAVLFETVLGAILSSRAGIKRWGTCMHSLRTHVAPFYFGHKNRKVTWRSKRYERQSRQTHTKYEHHAAVPRKTEGSGFEKSAACFQMGSSPPARPPKPFCPPPNPLCHSRLHGPGL